MEEVHEEGFENILTVMAEQQCVAALLPRNAVEIAAPEPRTERTIGAAGGHLLLHHRIGVAILDAMGNADLRQILGRTCFGKFGCP